MLRSETKNYRYEKLKNKNIQSPSYRGEGGGVGGGGAEGVIAAFQILLKCCDISLLIS